MSSEQGSARKRATPVATPKKFRDMNLTEKIAHCCKAVICVMTFGFAYPNIFVD